MDKIKQLHPAPQRRSPRARGTLGRKGRAHTLRYSLAVLVGLLTLWLAVPRPLLAQATGEGAIGPVYALRGTLTQAENQPFDTFLVLANGTQIGLVGETPLIEADIVALRVSSANPEVKVWGLRYAAPSEDSYDLIVVEEIQSADAVPTQTPEPVVAPPDVPTPEPTSAVPIAVVEAPAVNVRSGPSTNYSVVGNLTAGETCPIIGRNSDASWWLLSCSNGQRGWVSGALLAISGSQDLIPIVQPAPEPPSAPQTFSGWRAEYFDNQTLSGEPVLVQDVENINFNWGEGSPGEGVPADNFSARYERTLNFSYGNYVIQTTADDGVRVYVDDELIINDWTRGPARDRTFQRVLSGSHTIRIEYFEATGVAQLRFVTQLLSSERVWRVQYYDNRNLAGSPRVERDEPRSASYPLDFNWALGSPVPNTIPADNWSARWEGTFFFEGGDYRFNANVDDGIRIYLDGILVMDVWENGVHNGLSNEFYQLGRGNHRVTVEYYDSTSGAYLRVWWSRIGGGDDGGGGGDGRGRDE